MGMESVKTSDMEDLFEAALGPPPNQMLKPCGDAIVRLSYEGRGVEVGNGTGFFIRENGVLVTNAHVVEGVKDSLVAVLKNGQRKKVLGTLAVDSEHDLALLRVEGASYFALPLAQSHSIREGQDVYLIGSPYGLDQSLGVGVISALRADFTPEWKDAFSDPGRDIKGPLIQHTAEGGPGASGSPLMNAKCEVVGVHHSGMRKTHVNFGAHVDALRQLVARTDLSAPRRNFRRELQRDL